MTQENNERKVRSLLPLFPLGRAVVTPGAIHVLGEQSPLMLEMLARHAYGDWGNVCEEDAELNNQALEQGSRILSRYRYLNSDFYVITEHDRSLTTILLPEEY